MHQDELSECLFDRATKYLIDLGLLNMAEEEVHTIGVIIGGSVTQPIHFDVAKAECNQDTYEEVLRSPYAPVSLLLGLGGSTRLVIQKEDIDGAIKPSVDGTEMMCSVKGGISGEEFVVVSDEEVEETRDGNTFRKNVVTLECETGFSLKGDFCHAEQQLLIKLVW